MDFATLLRDKTNTIRAASWQNRQCGCVPSENSDQPGHPPTLITVLDVRMKKALVLSYPLSAQRRLWSDWADAQADLSLRFAHTHFVGFVTRRLIINYVRTGREYCLQIGIDCANGSLSLMNRLNQTESAVFNLWMLHFHRISFQIICYLNCDNWNTNVTLPE